MEESIQSVVTSRVHEPLVWARLSTGYRIENVREKHFEDAISLFKTYFLNEEMLCKCSLEHLDEDSISNYVETAYMRLRDGTSLCAIHEGTGEVVGILLNRIVDQLERTRTFSRIRLLENVGKAYMDVMTLRWQLHRSVDAFEFYGVEKYFRYNALCVHIKHRGKGIAMGLLTSGKELAQSLGMPAVVGLFTCPRSQALAFKMGLKTLSTLDYAQFQRNERLHFRNSGDGNNAAMMMGSRIEKGVVKPLSIYPPVE